MTSNLSQKLCYECLTYLIKSNNRQQDRPGATISALNQTERKLSHSAGQTAAAQSSETRWWTSWRRTTLKAWSGRWKTGSHRMLISTREWSCTPDQNLAMGRMPHGGTMRRLSCWTKSWTRMLSKSHELNMSKGWWGRRTQSWKCNFLNLKPKSLWRSKSRCEF